MNEWMILRQMKFDACTVTLYRSMWAMNKWKGETKYNTGETASIELENEKEAWRGFYIECRKALDKESARWD